MISLRRKRTSRRNAPFGRPPGARGETPEVVLFYKAGGDLSTAELAAARSHLPRLQDEQDLRARMPTLNVAQRFWLHESLSGGVRPEHPWLAHLVS